MIRLETAAAARTAAPPLATPLPLSSCSALSSHLDLWPRPLGRGCLLLLALRRLIPSSIPCASVCFIAPAPPPAAAAPFFTAPAAALSPPKMYEVRAFWSARRLENASDTAVAAAPADHRTMWCGHRNRT